MHSHIQQLARIGAKQSRLIIGLMSGTSLDGLDVALCKVSGHGPGTKIKLVQFATVNYNNAFKAAIRTIFSKRQVDLEQLCLLNPYVAELHSKIILQCLGKWNIAPRRIDLIASHGQTIYHAPQKLHRQKKFANATLQIGDGDHMARRTGIITLSDFRQKHIAAGGEGAPLAVYGDYLIFAKKGEDRIMLNIGGIANFTHLPASGKTNEIFSTDTGPGNTIMDAFIQTHFKGKHFDQDAHLAKQGTVHPALLKALLQHSFFKQSFPKTTGPELFNMDYLQQAMQRSGTTDLSHADIMATLSRFTAQTVCTAIQQVIPHDKPVKIFVSGGGMHNPLLLQRIQEALPHCIFNTTDALRINPDAKEAVLFALLANEMVSGNISYLGKGTPQMPAVTMGKISLPG
jgi:anhydro-N-acetylmuramic acid kinase